MSKDDTDQVAVRRAIEASIRIGLLFLFAILCGAIMAPFFIPIMWGAIIAIAVHPLYARLVGALGGRTKTAATLFTLVALALLITPTVMLATSAVESTIGLAEGIRDGTLSIKPPPDNVVSWPVIGGPLNDLWSLASTNLEAALQQYREQLVHIAEWLLSKVGSTVGSVLGFALSIIIAGIFLAVSKPSAGFLKKLSVRLVGEELGGDLAELSGATVRSVTQGVLGIAIIQALLAGILMLAFGVPFAGVWALFVLLLAVIQLPPILVLAPVIVYEFSVASTGLAVVFAILAVLVALADTFLKPVLLGRGVSIPMPVILIGAIGGMIAMGMLGLFVGAVVLSVGYKLFQGWLELKAEPEEVSDEPGALAAPAD